MIEPIDMNEMKQAFARAFILTKSLDVTPRTILARECARRGLSVSEITGPKRHREIAHPRQDIMRIIRDETDASLPQIGRLFNRDHTTVLHGIAASKRREEK
jgi:chromosomal replication initiator protein